MRKSRALVLYQLHLYGKSNRWVMPCLVWFLSMVVSYSIQPVQVGASILLSATIGFLIALWMGILESMPALKAVLWVLPPVADILAALANQEQFGVVQLAVWTVVSGIYIGIVFLISEWILERKNNYY